MCPFLTAQSPDGELFLCSDTCNCKLPVLSATSLAFLQHTHTHRLLALFGYVHVLSPPHPVPLPLPLVWHHLFWVIWPCFILTVGTLVFELRIRCPFVYTTDALHKDDTQVWGRRRWSLRCDRVQAFSNMEETQPWSCYGCFFMLSFKENQMLLSQASHHLKLIFSPLLMNAKITHLVTWRRESCIALSITFPVKNDLCMPPLLPEETMYVFG